MYPLCFPRFSHFCNEGRIYLLARSLQKQLFPPLRSVLESKLRYIFVVRMLSSPMWNAAVGKLQKIKGYVRCSRGSGDVIHKALRTLISAGGPCQAFSSTSHRSMRVRGRSFIEWPTNAETQCYYTDYVLGIYICSINTSSEVS